MGTPSVSVRCPTCGADLRVVLAPAPPTQWFPCPQCHNPVPVLVPRDPPPLYSWEVLPGLYPALPPPQRPRIRMRRLAQVALAIVASLAVLLGALLAVLGAQALGPGSYEVSGTVVTVQGPRTGPAVGATVILTNDAGAQFVQTTGAGGSFIFRNVVPGGISLNITLAGFAPATVTTFASPVYSAGTTGLQVTLTPGSSSNATSTVLSPFPNLETFVASIGSAVALLGIVALLSGWATVVTARSNRPAVGVVGGAGGFLAPVALYFLALGGVFPDLIAGTAVIAAVGLFAVTIRSLEILQVGPETRGA